ncbi:MAG: cupin domain-containing protein [Actinomycetota bacterium]|nr:cupin domain-containing protein [Actinomycetota bacterium]
MPAPLRITTAEVVLPCDEIEPSVDFFTERLGFGLDMIMPADDPAVAVLSGYGVRIRLVRDGPGDPGVLRLCGEGIDAEELTAPNGTRIEFVDASAPLVVPESPPLFELSRPDGGAGEVGRAGMHYRDLLPTRQGGRFIASHILIPEGGPVPDYVHHHRIRFQLIYCAAGWVRVVYEDQGPPFVLQAGDCVLQPPHIRHRVLESSPGLEVIEIGCPAEHETGVDHDMALPTPDARPERSFGGQRFVLHRAAAARWQPWRLAGFECRDTGIGAATDRLAGARVVRAGADAAAGLVSHDGELQFWYVLSGSATLILDGRTEERLAKGVAVAVPAGTPCRLIDSVAGLEFLEVTLPA